MSYISFYYCSPPHAQAAALLILVAWMVFLFSALGIVAGDFLAVNLGSIAQYMNMSDTLAGVTFLALGNGAPDIFSTIAAMSESSNNLALGELIGAAAFITGVVAGSMALMKPFRVDKISFIRDAVFLAGTIGFLHYVLHDGSLRLWHCVVLLAIYITYISVVLAWHWWRSRRAGAVKLTTVPTQSADRRVSTSIAENAPLLNGHEVDRTDSSTYPNEQRGHQSFDPAIARRRTWSVATTDSSQGRLNQALNTVRARCAQIQVPHLVRTTGRLIMLPARIALQLTVPRVKEEEESLNDVFSGNDGDEQIDRKDVDGKSWNRWMTAVHCFTAPQMFIWFVFKQLSGPMSQMFVPSMVCLGVSLLLAILVLATSSKTHKPWWYRLLCLPGFMVSIVWISSLADEMVAILGILGIVCNISNAIMGITVFAIGNSIDDWAADISVARRGHPLMAFSACFGGPLLNILLGISISGISGILKLQRGGDKDGVIDLKPMRSLFFVSWSVMINISLLIALMFYTRWKMTRIMGLLLVVCWIVATIVNVVLEMRQ